MYVRSPKSPSSYRVAFGGDLGLLPNAFKSIFWTQREMCACQNQQLVKPETTVLKLESVKLLLDVANET